MKFFVFKYKVQVCEARSLFLQLALGSGLPQGSEDLIALLARLHAGSDVSQSLDVLLHGLLLGHLAQGAPGVPLLLGHKVEAGGRGDVAGPP
eukprot:gnl/Hemi2/5478_TR1882_c0_g2_i1.p2 gnl/Hemi2/5478_TR1882_c0_g2~~gnl/Hemi2/5478_TR1882_c0_g2_i1.p2  ORF type:complete len:100 (+),score=23.24 gnl/Hemi2/5478_TR1882_c0_g2_i1:26-301(+)